MKDTSQMNNDEFIAHINQMLSERFGEENYHLKNQYFVALTKTTDTFSNQYIGDAAHIARELGKAAALDDGLMHLVACINAVGYSARLQKQLKEKADNPEFVQHMSDYINLSVAQLRNINDKIGIVNIENLENLATLINLLIEPDNASIFTAALKKLKKSDMNDINSACFCILGHDIYDNPVQKIIQSDGINPGQVRACIFGESKTVHNMFLTAFRRDAEVFRLMKNAVHWWEENGERMDTHKDVSKKDFNDFLNKLL